MKKRFLNLVGVAVMLLSVVAVAQEKAVDVAQSKLHWKGHKVTGEHSGDIQLKSGSLTFTDGKLQKGNFVVDMTTIAVTDIKGEMAKKLEGHLKNDDFFGVDKYQEATLKFDKVQAMGSDYKVNGSITIKGITQPIVFTMSVNGNKANVRMKIDRTKFGIKYKSNSFFDGLKDKAIYDEFDLNAELVF
ncbi:MAG: YceI family protein [Flavobacteriaceae bacterium]|nr:YceI family protein [Flavobacteriaceae bacterium]